VWVRDVVAPPMSSGILKPSRSISLATCAISSSDGVMSPESPTMSAFSLRAVSRIVSQATITPRSDDVEVVALEHHAHDVLADVVHVALDCRHHDLALGLGRGAQALLLFLDVRDEVRDRLLHHARGFHHLGQEHLPEPKRSPYDVHAVHERPLDHLQRALELQPRLLRVLDDVLRDALHEGVHQPVAHRGAAPGLILGGVLLLPLEAVGEFHEPLGRIRPAVEDHVLDALEQVLRDVRVDAQLSALTIPIVIPALAA
jgi:hypothetical protein